MAKKRSKKKKRGAGTEVNSGQRKPGLLIYVPAFCSLIGTLMLLTVIAAALPLTVPAFMGYDIYNVVSGSMEPAIPIGSIIYVKSVDPVDIEKSDIIAFQSGESVVMHRVVENNIINGTFTTKGDANSGEDISEVPYANLVGIVVRHIPVLGQLLTLFASTFGRFCMVCFAACGAILNVLAGRFRDYLNYERKEERLKEERLAAMKQAEQGTDKGTTASTPADQGADQSTVSASTPTDQEADKEPVSSSTPTDQEKDQGTIKGDQEAVPPSAKTD